MPEPTVTPTPYPTLNAWIPYPTATPFISVLPTPLMANTSNVTVVEYGGITSLIIAVAIVIGIGMAILARRHLT